MKQRTTDTMSDEITFKNPEAKREELLDLISILGVEPEDVLAIFTSVILDQGTSGRKTWRWVQEHLDKLNAAFNLIGCNVQ